MWLARVERWSRHWWVGALLLLNTLVRGWNLFGYPVFMEDEGTYVSQAMAILAHGQLAYYTYWYDHAPFGWILLAGWQLLTEWSPLMQELSYIEGARILMVGVSTLSLWLIIRILRELEVHDLIVKVMAGWLIFSPLAGYYQRIVFLDNLMVCWVLVSVYLLLKAKSGKRILGSAVTFALAILTKETAVFFAPLLLLLLRQKSARLSHSFFIPLWLTTGAVVLGQYAVFALLKGEFFPSDSWLGSPGQVSLLDAVLFQNDRGEAFWRAGSALRHSLSVSWLRLDPLLIILGSGSVLANLVTFRRSGTWYFGWWFGAGYIFYLLKWQALDWYVIPLIPIFGISLALLLQTLVQHVRTWLTGFALLGIITVGTGVSVVANTQIYTQEMTRTQDQAIQWAKDNVKAEDFVVIDNYAFLELNDPAKQIEDFQYHYFWKVEQDPDVRYELLAGQVENIDYLIMTEAMRDAFGKYDFPFLNEYVEQARVVKDFSGDYPVTVYALVTPV